MYRNFSHNNSFNYRHHEQLEASYPLEEDLEIKKHAIINNHVDVCVHMSTAALFETGLQWFSNITT